MHYAVRRAREAPMVFKALYVGRIANSALSRTIKEWYDATPADFKTALAQPPPTPLALARIELPLSKAGHVPFEWPEHIQEACESEGPHVRLLLMMHFHVG